MTIIKINPPIQPLAPIATSKDFVAAMLAQTVAFAACCATRAACLATYAVFADALMPALPFPLTV